jgi:hypothetical protein
MIEEKKLVEPIEPRTPQKDVPVKEKSLQKEVAERFCD